MTRFDPRHYQLIVQSTLLVWGIFMLQFPVDLSHIGVTLCTALITQWLFCGYFKLPFYTLSTLNTSLSLLLLLHTTAPLWLGLAAFIAIASKFLIRIDQRHIFNPSNIGIVISLLLFDQVWAAPGQWGHNLWVILLIAGFALIPIIGLRPMMTSISFLSVYTCLILLRAWWLGDPVNIPLHNLQNGALLLFTFFMLADPMTTPAHPLGRIIFGAIVALVSVFLLWIFYIPNAFLYALALCAFTSIPINRMLNHSNFAWKI